MLAMHVLWHAVVVNPNQTNALSGKSSKTGLRVLCKVLLRNAAERNEGCTRDCEQRKAWYEVIMNAVREQNVAALKTLIEAVPADSRPYMLQDALGAVYYHARHDEHDFSLSAYSHTECDTAVPLVDFLIQSGADVNVAVNESINDWQYDSGLCPLFRLAQYGCIDGIRRLVEVYGADINKQLHPAGSGYVHPRVHHDTALDGVCDQWYNPPKQSCSRAKLISALVHLGANAADALYRAVARGRLSLVKLLVALCNEQQQLARYSPLLQLEPEGLTALHEAARVPHLATDAQTVAILDALLTWDGEQLAQALVCKDREGKSPLHLAVSSRFITGVTRLLEVSSKLGILPTLLTQQDSSGTDVITLVRRMQGDKLIKVFEPYCSKVCNI
jgi:hypothetical protein